MKFRNGSIAVVLLLVMLTVTGVALAPLVSAPSPSGEETGDFRAFMQPRLTALLESATTVDGMVNGKSRNILALRSESNKIESITADIDAYLANHETPAWAQPVVANYRQGSQRIQTAIDAAYEAIRNFDFSKMADMIPVFDEGTRLLQRAVDGLGDTSRQSFVVH
jgi:hypothetical protein